MTSRETTLPIAKDANIPWRALAEEIAAVVDPVVCDAWHRGAGIRVARRHPLSVRTTLDAFQTGVNAILASLEMGRARYDFDGRTKIVTIVHDALPPVERASSAGRWLPAFLEGVHSTWLGQQRTSGDVYLSISEAPGSDDDVLTFVYGRPERVHAFAPASGRPGGRMPIEPDG